MSLEACPACGYALSIVDHQCRHCARLPVAGTKFAKIDAAAVCKGLVVAVGVSLLVFWALRGLF